MPPGVPNIKQLDKLVSAALLQALAGQSQPSAAPSAGGLSFLSDPKFLNALNTGTGLPAPSGGRQSDTKLPANVSKLEASVNKMGFEQPHHSIFGKILNFIEKPYYGVTGAIEKQSQWANKKPKNESAWDRIVHSAEALGSGFVGGIEGKNKKTYADLQDEFGNKSNGVPKFLQVSKNDPLTNTGVGRLATNFTGDVVLDPLTYTGLGAVTKVKDLGRTAETIAKANKVRDLLEEAGHEKTDAIPRLLLGRDIKEGKWYKKGALPNSAQREETMQRVTGIANKYGEESWNKLLANLRGTATGIVAKQGYQKFDTVKQLRTALKGTGKLSKYGGNVKKEQLTEWNHFVDRLIHKHGDEAFKIHNPEEVSGFLKQAEEKAAGEGFVKYNSVKELRTALKGTGRLSQFKGNLTKEHLIQWNSHVDKVVEDRADTLLQGLKGEKLNKIEHIKNAAADVLEVAAKSNLVNPANQIEKRMALRFAGKDVARFKIPDKAAEVGRALAASKAATPARDLVTNIQDNVNTIFRTGSHIDPVVNAMRMAAHSSVVETINRHVTNLNSIWGGISKETRKNVAEDVTQGLEHAAIPGGRDLNHGVDVTNLVSHTLDEVKHIESLVGEHEGALVTFKEMNKELPKPLQIASQYHQGDRWLKNAWHEQFLSDSAPYALKRISEDPATLLHTMQKAILSASAKKQMHATIMDRFGIALRGTQSYGMKRAKNPAAEMLRDKHGYRTPKYVRNPGERPIPLPGYEDHVFHPDVAKGIEAVHQMLSNDARLAHGMTTNKYTGLFKDATQMFKSVVTKFNPGFHERNLIGEMANSAADGVLSSKPYRKAIQVLRLHGSVALDSGEAVGRRTARIHNGIMPDAYERARIAALNGNDVVIHKRFTITTETGDHFIKGVTPDMIWHAYVANGLKTGWITTEFGKVVEGGAFRRGFRGINKGAQHLTENIEDYTRLAHFISRIERSPLRNFERAAEEAATYVRKFHFDYNDFTHVEKNLISRAIPFYKWTRKNIPLQLALMFQKPGYMLAQMKALNAISQVNGYRNNGNLVPNAGEVMPQWLRDSLAVPVGAGSSGTRYLDAPLPTRDAFKFFGEGVGGTTTNLGFMLNPFIKDPIEYKTGHQIGGAPIQTDRYMAAMTPYTNLIHNLRNSGNTGKSTQLMQFLSGLGLIENTPARMKSELKRMQSEQSAARKKYRTSHGALPVGGRPK